VFAEALNVIAVPAGGGDGEDVFHGGRLPLAHDSVCGSNQRSLRQGAGAGSNRQSGERNDSQSTPEACGSIWSHVLSPVELSPTAAAA
jgi:hypothetical protein